MNNTMNQLELLLQDMDQMVEECQHGTYVQVSRREKAMQDEIYHLREQLEDQRQDMRRQERIQSLYLERIDELTEQLQVAEQEKGELRDKVKRQQEKKHFYQWLYEMEQEYINFQNEESGSITDPDEAWQEHKRRRVAEFLEDDE
jgi:chromosome segregation ATPase